MALKRNKPEEIVTKLRQVEVLVGQWRRHYNTKRPHSALGYRPPAPEAVVPMDLKPAMH
jgi:transposase InsO family protein